MRIHRYYAVETDEVARTAAYHHLVQLQQQHPHLLSPAAVISFQTALPNDIRLISRQHLACLPHVDLLFAGWECQDHSAAGRGLGLSDPRSSLFYELIRVLTTLEDIQCTYSTSSMPSFAYICENVASHFDRRAHIRADFEEIRHYLGSPVVIDAARHGSGAHRLRAFWTNLVEPHILTAANQLVTRFISLNVNGILDPHHRAQICTRAAILPGQ